MKIEIVQKNFVARTTITTDARRKISQRVIKKNKSQAKKMVKKPGEKKQLIGRDCKEEKNIVMIKVGN